ncbi:LysR substrate-binding domain-containing protein [Ruegeria sp. 2012CJ15-1]
MKAFYSAAEHMSFLHAGQELGVSAAAVSQQVKNLETHLGNDLFMRRGNKLILTDSGEAVFEAARRAFREISDTTRHVRNVVDPAKVVVSALPSIADRWLLPRLIAFRQSTGASVEIRVESDPVHITRDGIDIRITNKSKYYTDLVETKLYDEVAVAVCAPDFWDRYGANGISGLSSELLIHNDWGPEFMSEPTWEKYWLALGMKREHGPRSGYTVNTTSLALALAREGAGIALAPRRLAQPDLDLGTLIAPVSATLKMEKSYVCLSPRSASSRHLVAQIIEVLKR